MSEFTKTGDVSVVLINARNAIITLDKIFLNSASANCKLAMVCRRIQAFEAREDCTSLIDWKRKDKYCYATVYGISSKLVG